MGGGRWAVSALSSGGGARFQGGEGEGEGEGEGSLVRGAGGRDLRTPPLVLEERPAGGGRQVAGGGSDDAVETGARERRPFNLVL